MTGLESLPRHFTCSWLAVWRSGKW